VGAYLSGGLDSSLIAALAVHARQDRLRTFSVRFEDTEFDETAFQRTMAATLGSDHHEVLVSRRDIAECFPDLITHTERPLLRTAAAPLFLLSRLVSQSGIKVVLTGEGADEMFAGYDLFREAAVRRFWARRPASTMRPRLLERLYPYLTRSPVAQGAISRQFFGQHLAHWDRPGFSHGPRWQTTAGVKRLFAPDLRQAIAASDRSNVVGDFLRTLPEDFHRWSFLAQDQYIETRTLFSGYLLSSQGDRVLMAHSVEGRFPFLDVNVVALANSLPAAYKLRGLNEKHVLKRAARGLVDPSVLERKKQPYRAPDAQAFVGADAPDWVHDVLSPSAISEAGVFVPEAVAQLWAKLQARRNAGQYSNVDNMAIVGVLSTQLLHRQFIARAPQPSTDVRVTTLVDAVAVTT
jgi:asparagine synthase (glutamine-hydrolysing)